MISGKISRRTFVKGSASAFAFVSMPTLVLGQTIRVRLEWQEFRSSPQYGSFYNAIRSMRANTRSTSPASWRYWTNVHVNYCPHNVAYFLAWHRGYIYHFEQQLRTVSGNSALTLPYWDYYRSSTIPSEFTDPTSALYIANRQNTNVYNALDLSPFDPSVYNFERGRPDAFETRIESAPHNPVHNIIGGVMADMQSPLDPIFFLHHANIDRLWHAWALPDGKGMPASTTSYWSGNFRYASNLTIQRNKTYYPGWLGYDYADNSRPTALPPQADSTPRIIRVQAQAGQILNRPPVGRFATAPGRAIAANRRSLGAAQNIGLADNSVTVQIPLQAADAQTVRDLVSAAKEKTAPAPAGGFQSAKVVLDGVQLTGAGQGGGFFYNVYLNLPESGDATPTRRQYFLGTIGAFELAGASHHGGGMLEYPATEVLANLDGSDLRDIYVSLVRVNGNNAPRGQVMLIKEARLEVSNEEPWDRSTPPPKSGCYC